MAGGSPQLKLLVEDSVLVGVPGLANLFGIESPGLTASLALGALAAQRLLRPCG